MPLRRLLLVGLLALAASVTRAGPYELIAGGAEKMPPGRVRKVAVDATVEVGPHDVILVTLWARPRDGRNRYELADDLELTLVDAVPGAGYGKGFRWARKTDWDAERGSPDSDTRRNAAWSYGRVPFGRGGVRSERPWYAGRSSRLGKFRDGAWKMHVAPSVGPGRLTLYARAAAWSGGSPVVRWRNPTGARARLTVAGDLTLRWLDRTDGADGAEGAEGAEDDLHYAVVLKRSPRPVPLVEWQADRRLRGVRAVFTHPTLPSRLAVTTASGLVLSSDLGASWKAADPGHRARLGEVNSVTFAPHSGDAFYAATASNGLLATSDGGETFRPAGSARSGMASDCVRAVFFYPGDPSFRTLLAVHGEAAPGISRSADAGRSWRVTTRGFHVFGLCHGKATERSLFYMIASKKDSPEVTSVWSSPGLGDYWYEILRDVLVTDGVHATVELGRSYWSTLDKGLYRFQASWSAVTPERAGPADADEWTSVGVAPGWRAGSEIVYAYEPRRFGFVVSEDGMTTYSSQSRGLIVGPYVRDGAHVRANANGTAFLAAVNGALYVGRVRAGALSVVDVSARPPVVTYARNAYVSGRSALGEFMEGFAKERNAAAAARELVELAREADRALSSPSVEVVARVAGDARPASVTVDLGPLAGGADTPMFAMLDDGRHGDGAAGDGVYGARYLLRPAVIMPDRRESRRDVSGPVDLRVSALSADGREATAPCILPVLPRRESVVFWNEKGAGVWGAEGGVTGAAVKDPNGAFEGETYLEVRARAGPWRMAFGSDRTHYDVTGYHALSFRIRSESEARDELYVHLADRPVNSFPVSTGRVPLLGNALIEGGSITDEYRHAVVPFAMLLAESEGFQPRITTFVGFSGAGKAGVRYRIDDIRFLATEEDLEAERAKARDAEEEPGAGPSGIRRSPPRRQERQERRQHPDGWFRRSRPRPVLRSAWRLGFRRLAPPVMEQWASNGGAASGAPGAVQPPFRGPAILPQHSQLMALPGRQNVAPPGRKGPRKVLLPARRQGRPIDSLAFLVSWR